MRTSTEVDKFTVLIKAHLIALGNIIKTTQFVALLTNLFDLSHRFFTGAFDAGELLVFFDHLLHLKLDRFEISSVELLI